MKLFVKRNIKNPITEKRELRAMVWGVGNTVGGAAGIAVYTVLYPYIGLADAMWIMLLFAIISGLMLPLLPAKDKKYETVT